MRSKQRRGVKPGRSSHGEKETGRGGPRRCAQGPGGLMRRKTGRAWGCLFLKSQPEFLIVIKYIKPPSESLKS